MNVQDHEVPSGLIPVRGFHKNQFKVEDPSDDQLIANYKENWCEKAVTTIARAAAVIVIGCLATLVCSVAVYGVYSFITHMLNS